MAPHDKSPIHMFDIDTCFFLMLCELPTSAAQTHKRPVQKQLMFMVTFAESACGGRASVAALRKKNCVVLNSLASPLAVPTGNAITNLDVVRLLGEWQEIVEIPTSRG